MRDGLGARNLKASRPFDEQNDDMDAYLEKYERFATSQEWDKGDWAVSLSPLFTGKSTGLFQRQELTEDGYPWKF